MSDVPHARRCGTGRWWLALAGCTGWAAWALTLVAMLNWDFALKAVRRLVVEERVPWVAEPFEQNRNYVLRRELFATYPKGSVGLCFVGDSIFAYPSWHEYFRDYNVAVRAIEGDRTDGLLARLPEVIELSPAIVVIHIGINDLRLGAHPAAVASRILSASARLQAAGIETVLVGMLPVSREVSKYETINLSVADANALLRDGAKRLGVPFIDLRPLLAPAGYLDYLNTYDGIHLTARAYQVLTQEIKARLSDLVVNEKRVLR